ncbi:hypothetical protein FGB62_71g214 [Gracilaria domingensis]|nr:hypothetical protein FGB62_71g214 [Gracilaria domingensis]
MSSASVLDALRASRQHTLSNAAVLDHIASPHHSSSDTAAEQRRSPSPDTPMPISKHVLTAVFSALDRPPAKTNYVFVENSQQNHHLYGLVLPLIARVFAVSCPGLLAVVQLPRSDTRPEWATQSSDDGYGSNGSNGSKSNAATIPSFVGNSRTPSPSDDGNSTDEPKPNSPEPTRTAAMLKHPDQQQQKHPPPSQQQQQQQNPSRSEPANDRTSPSPDAVNQDYRAMRLICNGFEVLTGKMPPPRKHMGRFTLATVGWEKAGVIQPSHPSRGLSMSFSNGMVTPTEGIVVTFSNGSLCLLTLSDPLSDLQALNVSHETPVMVFTFAAVGRLSVGELISKSQSSLTEAAMRVKTICDRPNFMFVEIGHGGASPVNPSTPEQMPDPDCAHQEHSKQQASLPNLSKPDSVQSAQERPPIPRYIPIDAVPRAIPLFVNTINQCFIDPPYQDIPEHAYENALLNDRYRVGKEQQPAHPAHPESIPFPRHVDAPKTTEKPTPEAQRKSSPEPTPKKPQTNRKGVIRSVANDDEKASKAQEPPPDANNMKTNTSSKPEARNRETTPPGGPQSSYPAMYGYYGYRPDQAYPGAHQQGHDHFTNRVIQHPAEVDRNHIHPNHAAYYLPHATNGVIPNGAYGHQHGSSYAVGAYYSMGSHHGLPHQHPERAPGWHHGIQSIPHSVEHAPNSHLAHHAGRDVPVAYASHRQFQPSIGGQFPSSYYVVPPSSQMYGQIPAAAVQHPKRPGYSQSFAETYNSVSHVERAATGGQIPVAGRDRGGLSSSKAAIPVAKGSTITSNPPDRKGAAKHERRTSASHEEGETDEEKEKALQVLVGMRESSIRRRPTSDAPKESADTLSNIQDYRNRSLSLEAPASEHRTFIHMPHAATEGSMNNHNAGPSVPNGVHASPSRRTGLKRSQRNSDTQSSTSTNSQGTMLIKGAVTGNSHVPGQGYASWKQKRARQR